jgi:glycosyltransferase involved in cell wall biosynthesis
MRFLIGAADPQTESINQLEQSIRSQGIDIVWFLTPPGIVVSSPFITVVWDLEHRLRPYFPEVSVTGWTWDAREKSYSTVLPRASRVLTGTQAGKDEILRFYGLDPNNVEVVPFPVPGISVGGRTDWLPNIREKYGIKQDFVFYPAQFWPHKNHVNLLLALQVLKRSHGLEIDMVFTGSDMGNLGHVLRTIDELALRDQVRVLGFVPREDLEALYRNAIALTFASFFGPDNIPPLEAFALDCPVVASRVAGAVEQLGEAALLFDPTHPHDIARAIVAVHRDRELREKLLRNGAKIASERTLERYIAQVCKILDDFEPIRRCWSSTYVHT